MVIIHKSFKTVRPPRVNLYTYIHNQPCRVLSSWRNRNTIASTKPPNFYTHVQSNTLFFKNSVPFTRQSKRTVAIRLSLHIGRAVSSNKPKQRAILTKALYERSWHVVYLFSSKVNCMTFACERRRRGMYYSRFSRLICADPFNRMMSDLRQYYNMFRVLKVPETVKNNCLDMYTFFFPPSKIL
jgi:hypothetical protein